MVLGSLPFRAFHDVRTNELLNADLDTTTAHVTDRLAIEAPGRVHRHGPRDRGGLRIDRRRAGGYASA